MSQLQNKLCEIEAGRLQKAQDAPLISQPPNSPLRDRSKQVVILSDCRVCLYANERKSARRDAYIPQTIERGLF